MGEVLPRLRDLLPVSASPRPLQSCWVIGHICFPFATNLEQPSLSCGRKHLPVAPTHPRPSPSPLYAQVTFLLLPQSKSFPSVRLTSPGIRLSGISLKASGVEED